MKILITGAAGYIGSELIQFLLESGHQVQALDSLEYDPDSLLRYVGHEDFNFEKLDDPETVKKMADMFGINEPQKEYKKSVNKLKRGIKKNG